MKQKRTTVAKMELIQVLSKASEALSHAELYDRMKEICDRVTVYRLLDRLTEEGVAHRIPISDGTVKFALCETCEEGHHNHAHIHFNCRQCGTVTCLDAEVPVFRLPANYKAHDINMVVTGVCSNCC